MSERVECGEVPEATSVTVAVVTWNSAAVLPGLIESLPAGCAGLTWHLVVADNASSDDSVAVVRELAPEATIVSMGRNAGYAAGVNAAVSAASSHTAVLVLNPDVRLGPGSILRLADSLRQSGVGIAVPRLQGARGELIESMRREPTLVRALADAVLGATRAGRWGTLGEVVTDPGAYARENTSDWAEGSTQLVSSECLLACGPWDESFFLYSEETDFHLRARDAGFVIRYVPGATAIHLEGDSAASPRLWALLVANRLRLFRRRHGALSSAVYWALLVVREATRAGLGRQPSRAAVRVLFSPGRLRAQRGPDWLEKVH